MSELRRWLESRSLAALEPALVENDIDIDLLAELSDDDMREIGLTLGQRKRLRGAIDAGLDGAAPSPRPAPAAPAAREAERRQLTVMFVDLVGSSALSAALDPEDMRDVITGYQNAVAGVVTRYEGHVAKYMGDGVLCYFGWPRAHEDDARRAARAGLEVTRVIGALKTPDGKALSARVGVATGLVIVGDLIGEGAAQEEAVVGDTPNLAARLQEAARGGEVIVADATRQLLDDAFELVDLGLLELKGLAAPVPGWRVAAQRNLSSRFERHALDPVSAMVGRDHELALIMERWGHALRGEGQVVVLTGDAGIGKSRLTRAVIDAVRAGEHERIMLHCSPYHADSSFYPLVQHLSHALRLEEAEDAAARLERLKAGLAAADPRIMAELLQLGGADLLGPLDLTPQQLRNRIMEESSEEMRALARRKPLLFIIEDAHWIDASTLAMLEACLDKIANERALMLISARPTFTHGFGGHPIVSKLALNRLGSEQTAGILSAIAGGKALPEELTAEIIARTDGVPLFAEELTKTILESGQLRETATAYELTGPISRMTIPATLHDSLMARIDRLQPIKEVAQMAACIGRAFDRATLAEVARLDGRTLDDALEQLEQSELVFRRGAAPAARYVFKHALVRDVAYESLLTRRRQEIHARLADIFEADAATPPEIVAHHATEAGLRERAIEKWAEAGARAQARPAYDEASNHMRMALSLIGPLRDRAEWRAREVAHLVRLAQIHIARDGYASPTASEIFARALEMKDDAEGAELRIAIYYGVWIGPYIGNRLRRAYDLASRLVEEMEGETAPIPRLIARRMRAATLIAMGRPTEALADLELAYELYRSARIDDFEARFAQDPGVQIWCYILLATWLSGDEAGAFDIADRSLARAETLGHANTLCYAALHDVTLAIWTSDIARARKANAIMREVSTEHDMAFWKLYVDIYDTVIACMADEPGAAARLDPALEAYAAAGGGLWTAFYRAEQAKHLLRAGEAGAAEAALRRARDELESSGERWVEAELHRIEGDIRRARGDEEGARHAYRDALDVARAQKARALAARAEAALASLAAA